MRHIFAFILVLCSIQLLAQENKAFKVGPGEDIIEVLLSNNALYQYPEFMNGIVKFKHGGTGNGLMNYNRLLGEMQFIDAKNDTISLGQENEIKTVQLGKDTFFFQQGYLQLIENFSVVIAKKSTLDLSNKKRIGGFGESNPTATTYSAFWSQRGMKTIAPNEELTFREKTTYFIGDRFGYFKPLNRKTLFDYYDRNEKAVEIYLRNNPVNFSHEQDVVRLINYLKTL